MSSPDFPPPPSPAEARSWGEYTTSLRELYQWCSAPKYRALSGRYDGLSPAAISNLIGRNPLSRPPENTALRFAEACLRYRGRPDVDAALTEWRTHWKRLADAEAAPEPAESTVAPETTAGPQRTVTRRGGAALALVLVAATGTAVALTRSGAPDPPAPGAYDPALAVMPANARSEICQRIPGSNYNDPRNKRVWTEVYECANHPGSTVYEWAAPGARTASLETRKSWFACWARGARHSGGNDVWYYTQGDRAVAKRELDAWGFVPSSVLYTSRHPNPGVLRECPFPARPSRPA